MERELSEAIPGLGAHAGAALDEMPAAAVAAAMATGVRPMSGTELARPLPALAELPGRRGLSRRALFRVWDYMQANLGAHVTLDHLARAACVSRAHFARLFRISTGTSPMAYLLALRVERAKRLLDGERQVCEVAAELGFCDQSHFSRVFRRMTGTTPRDFTRLQG